MGDPLKLNRPLDPGVEPKGSVAPEEKPPEGGSKFKGLQEKIGKEFKPESLMPGATPKKPTKSRAARIGEKLRSIPEHIAKATVKIVTMLKNIRKKPDVTVSHEEITGTPEEAKPEELTTATNSPPSKPLPTPPSGKAPAKELPTPPKPLPEDKENIPNQFKPNKPFKYF